VADSRWPCLAGPKVMVADDDPDVLAIVGEFLVDFGYNVLCADSGEQALVLLAVHPDLALLITDIRMPGMNGFELAERALMMRAGLKVILISGYFSTHEMPHPFLRKPFRMRLLREMVTAVLSGQTS
jgi:two-component system cell cycle response regulator CpdR